MPAVRTLRPRRTHVAPARPRPGPGAVLPIPPGPVSVTSRTSGAANSLATSSMSSSRPSNEVGDAGQRRSMGMSHVVRFGRRDESLAQQQRQVVAHQAIELVGIAERSVRLGAFVLELLDHRRESILAIGRRHLDVDQAGERVRQLELVFEPRDVHVGADPAVALASRDRRTRRTALGRPDTTRAVDAVGHRVRTAPV